MLYDLSMACQKEGQIFWVPKNTNLAIYMSWRNMLSAKIVEHDFYLDCIAVKALVHLSRLDEVANI